MNTCDLEKTAEKLPKRTKVLLVASTGGHLEQLHLWSTIWNSGSHQRYIYSWVTFRSPQSEALLSDQVVYFTGYIQPRSGWQVLKSFPDLIRVMLRERPRVVVSTGAAIAVPAMMLAVILGSKAIYIESLARVDRLSLTARLVSAIPGVHKVVQHPGLASRNWDYAGSILKSFRAKSREEYDIDRDSLSILVTVGTIKPYGFNRLLEAVDSVASARDTIVWQVGESTYVPSRGEVFQNVSRSDLIKRIEVADVVVSHAGVGSILSFLRAGKFPILVPRKATHHEHVDDHQIQIATVVRDLGLATVVDGPDNLSREAFRLAARTCVVPA